MMHVPYRYGIWRVSIEGENALHSADCRSSRILHAASGELQALANDLVACRQGVKSRHALLLFEPIVDLCANQGNLHQRGGSFKSLRQAAAVGSVSRPVSSRSAYRAAR
jgi:hypothetical protein